MISISGIKYQKELEQLPYFNKIMAGRLIGKQGKNLDKKIAQLKKKGYLLPLKKGLYVTSSFFERLAEKKSYQEYLANILRYPSYLSLEYALSDYGLIPEGVFNLTSITVKTSRSFENFLGTFNYKKIKNSLFFGFVEKDFLGRKIKIASLAKALFDFLYLKKLNNPQQELTSDLRLNWENFDQKAFSEFSAWVQKANSPKMEKVLKILKKIL